MDSKIDFWELEKDFSNAILKLIKYGYEESEIKEIVRKAFNGEI